MEPRGTSSSLTLIQIMEAWIFRFSQAHHREAVSAKCQETRTRTSMMMKSTARRSTQLLKTKMNGSIITHHNKMTSSTLGTWSIQRRTSRQLVGSPSGPVALEERARMITTPHTKSSTTTAPSTTCHTSKSSPSTTWKEYPRIHNKTI